MWEVMRIPRCRCRAIFGRLAIVESDLVGDLEIPPDRVERLSAANESRLATVPFGGAESPEEQKDIAQSNPSLTQMAAGAPT